MVALPLDFTVPLGHDWVKVNEVPMRPIFYVACAFMAVVGLMMFLGGVAPMWCLLPLAIWLALVFVANWL